MLPQINNPVLDVYTIGDYKLCCYINCLILGQPTYKNGVFCFEANSYLKISEHHFFRYFNFFTKTLQLTEQLKPEEKNKETALIAQDDELLDSNCITYTVTEIESSPFQIVISYKYSTKITFSFDFEELLCFFKGFRNLCFKVYCYPSFVDEYIFHAIRKKPIDFFKTFNDCNVGVLEYLSLFPLLEHKDFFYIQVILARHQTLLCKIKCSYDIIKDETNI